MTGVTISQAGATDATQGFGASAEDVAADTKASEIPDPAEFGDGGAKQSSGIKTEPPARNERTINTEDSGPMVDKPPATSPAIHPAARIEANRALVIGLPLLAAAVLMGVYWMILRFGAV
jgi:hypothetical protein